MTSRKECIDLDTKTCNFTHILNEWFKNIIIYYDKIIRPGTIFSLINSQCLILFGKSL